MRDECRFLTTLEAAECLGLSPHTLSTYRTTGKGPEFHRFGSQARYLQVDLDAWAAKRRHASAADDGSAVAGEHPGPRPQQ